MLRRYLVAGLALSVTLAVASCSSDNDPPAGYCPEYVVPPDLNLQSPSVSYVRDVLPIFKTRCGLTPFCHSTQDYKN
jgi:hypothetical protein